MPMSVLGTIVVVTVIILILEYSIHMVKHTATTITTITTTRGVLLEDRGIVVLRMRMVFALSAIRVADMITTSDYRFNYLS